MSTEARCCAGCMLASELVHAQHVIVRSIDPPHFKKQILFGGMPWQLSMRSHQELVNWEPSWPLIPSIALLYRLLQRGYSKNRIFINTTKRSGTPSFAPSIGLAPI